MVRKRASCPRRVGLAFGNGPFSTTRDLPMGKELASAEMPNLTASKSKTGGAAPQGSAEGLKIGHRRVVQLAHMG